MSSCQNIRITRTVVMQQDRTSLTVTHAEEGKISCGRACSARVFGGRAQHRRRRRLLEDAAEAARRPVGVQGQPRSPARVTACVAAW